MDEKEFTAHVRHIAWVSFQIAAGQPYNVNVNDDQLESLLDGIQWREVHPEATAEENHNNWMKRKREQGWKYGPKKDFEKKEHPDLVPFAILPECEKRKDKADLIAHDLARHLWTKL